MSWKPEVLVQGESKWHRNGLCFATEQEAKDNARDLMYRWMLVNDWRAVEVDEPVTHTYVDGRLKHIIDREAAREAFEKAKADQEARDRIHYRDSHEEF